MNKYTLILTVLFPLFLRAQTKDYRAGLKIKGAIKEICVSPQGKIWLPSSKGNLYYTNHIDSNWHYGPQLFAKDTTKDYDIPHLENISFFDEKRAIMIGYIEATFNKKVWDFYAKAGYYLTQDGGKMWELRIFGGNDWLYDAYTDENGNAWMGGSSGNIYYSNDFGQNWKTLNSPYDLNSRMHSIYMLNEQQGISGSLENYIYTTQNNWKSYKRIKAPLHQRKYREIGIEKIRIWGDYFVVSHGKSIYYTRQDKIKWQKFEHKLIDFEIDKKTQHLYAITRDLQVLLFTSPTDYQFFLTKKLPKKIKNIKVVNNALYVLFLDKDVAKIIDNQIYGTQQLTFDRKIEKPKRIQKSSTVTWGISGKNIYLSDDTIHWYHEKKLDFYVRKYQLLSDSIAILWNGVKNYQYSLKSKELIEYEYKKPFQSFFDSPIDTLKISYSLSSRLSHYFSITGYKLDKKIDNLVVYQFDTTDQVKMKIHVNELYKIIENINQTTDKVPDISDFQITEAHKELFKKKAREYTCHHQIDKKIYYSMLDSLSIMNSTRLQELFNHRGKYWNSVSRGICIEVINQKGEKIEFLRRYNGDVKPYFFPWYVNYKNQYFNCYNIELTKFFFDTKFYNRKENHEKVSLLMEIAHFLYEKHYE